MSNRIAFTDDINNPTMNAVRRFGKNGKQAFSTAPRGQNASQIQDVSETYIPPVRDPTSTTTAIIVVIIIVVIIILAGWLIYTCCTPSEPEPEYEKIIEFYGGENDICPKCGKPLDGEDKCTCGDEEFYLEGGRIRRRRAVRAARIAKAAKKLKKAKAVVKARKLKKLAKAKAIVKAHKAKKAVKKAKVAKVKKVVASKKRLDENGEFFENLI